MPRVLNIRDLPGFANRKPIVPSGAVYIGRASGWYDLRRSDWANLPLPQNSTPEERDQSIADYEARLRCDPVKMARLSELRGHDLVCWCAPKRCHGDVLLRLANG
jgi:hypothetical protein